MSPEETIPRSPVASAVKALREKRGLTQEQFAKQLGVSLPTVGRYETTHKPSRSMLVRFVDMCEDYDLPELVPIFSEAAARPISDDSHRFGRKARLAAVEKYVLDATALLEALRNSDMHSRDRHIDSRSDDPTLRELHLRIKTLHEVVDTMLGLKDAEDTRSARSRSR